MFTSGNLTEITRRNICLWMTLAFQAGALNTGGFLACGRFVTHVTGFATLFGSDLGRGEPWMALSMLSVPGFFVVGAMTSAALIDRRLMQGRPPAYPAVLALLTTLHAVIFGLGVAGRFGPFSQPDSPDYLLLALLCLVSGAQNALVTSASGAVVRTTHLTGVTTDLGIGLVRLFSGGHRTAQEQRAVALRLGLIGSFVAGATVGAFLFLHFEFLGFLLPVGVSAGLLVELVRHQTQPPNREAP